MTTTCVESHSHSSMHPLRDNVVMIVIGSPPTWHRDCRAHRGLSHSTVADLSCPRAVLLPA